jgi:hypothetical protein
MTVLKMLILSALISTISGTSALGQAAISEPGAFEAEYPNRDVLNGGALTPAGRMGLELQDGASLSQNAYAAMNRANLPLQAKRSYPTATYRTPTSVSMAAAHLDESG